RPATKRIDPAAPPLLVPEDARHRVLDPLSLAAPADVAEVGRPPPSALHEVERAHAQTRAVADDSDVAVERNVGQPSLFGLDLVGVARDHGPIQLLEVVVPPRGVVVDLELGVARDAIAILRLNGGFYLR